TGKPIIGVNHWLGHIYSNFIEQAPEFPILNLIVSGGHTGLVLMKNHKDITQIGQTLDDSAGEAFDKVASMLGLPYPGGPAVSKLAKKGDSKTFSFPRSMLNQDNFDFSFSGLKTAVLYKIKDIKKLTPKTKADIAASFQQTVIDILIGKTLKVAQKFKVKSVCLSGGVSANFQLRKQFKLKTKKVIPQSSILYPLTLLCTDNAAMIGVAAAFQPKKAWTKYSKIQTNPNLRI
ncbi:unnamed protein product, partial [marine sediment metagenome]